MTANRDSEIQGTFKRVETGELLSIPFLTTEVDILISCHRMALDTAQAQESSKCWMSLRALLLQV